MKAAICAAFALAAVGCQVTPGPCASDGSCMLPVSRNTDYDPALPVRSADLDDIQDAIVGMKLPPHWRWFVPPRGMIETNIAFSVGDAAAFVKASADAAEMQFMIPPLPEGTRIIGVGAYMIGTGAGETVAAAVYEPVLATGLLTANSMVLNQVNPNAAPGALYIFNGVPFTPAHGAPLIGLLRLAKMNDTITSFGIQVDRL